MGVTVALAALALLAPAMSAGLEGHVPSASSPLGASSDYRRAVALDLAGRYREAVPHYERAAARETASRASHHLALSRGILDSLEQLRRFPQSMRHYFRLGVDAANKLAALKRETGVVARSFLKLAEGAFLRAERLSPNLLDPTICLAGLYADAGMRDRARATIARIRGRRMRAGEIYNLACYYHSMGRYDLALRLLGKVMNDHYRRWILASDDFYQLRGDPRFERLLGAWAWRRLR